MKRQDFVSDRAARVLFVMVSLVLACPIAADAQSGSAAKSV
jgi:hypothetical protein